MLDRAIVEPVTLILASGFFTGAFGLWLKRAKTASAQANATGDATVKGPSNWAYRFTILGGILLAGGVWSERLLHDEGLIFDNHLDVFLLLGLLLSAMMGYFRLTRHLRGLSSFLLPMIALVLLVGGALALWDPRHKYDYQSMLVVVHVLTIVAGSVCFAGGCVSGVVYLVADKQLRRKEPGLGTRWLFLPPLGALEKFIAHMVYLGFPLLTLAMVTGFVRAWQMRGKVGNELEALGPKVVLSVLVWLVYAFLIHVHFAPSFRGRKAAWLSIIGFVLLLGVYFTVTQVRVR